MRQREQVIRDLVEQWIRKAEEDFWVAEHLLSVDAPHLSPVGFHAQQAAEKFLKAFLTRHQVEVPRTHDLGDLLDLVASVDPSSAESMSEATGLNPYGVAQRYPGSMHEVTVDDASSALSLASLVRETVLALLKDYVDKT